MKFSVFRGKQKTTAGPGLGLWFLSQGLILYHRYLRATSRVHHIGLEHMQALDNSPKGFVLSVWHGNFVPVTMGFFKQIKTPSTVLTSRSPYGAFLTPFVYYLGYKVLRGSGTGKAANKPKKIEKGGNEAFHKMLDILGHDENIIMTADIAPGPSYEAGEGIVLLSSRSGCPIVPISAAYKRYKFFPKSWDKFQLPLGFSRYVVVWGEPFYAKPNLDRDGVEAERQRLTDHKNKVFETAYAQAGLPLPFDKTDNGKS